MKKIAIVVPCLNEDEVLVKTSKVLKAKIDEFVSNNLICKSSYILFVDDGSVDQTWSIITKLNRENETFKGLKLSSNNGHQNALLAGLITASEDTDAVISVDADLQDDISILNVMIDKFLKGRDIVYGVRSQRNSDTLLKKSVAQVFYKIMILMGVKIVYNHADFRLTSKRVLDSLSDFKEVNLFLRGIFPLIGFKEETVEYVRNKRSAGTSKYPFKKMVSFALDGITSFSTVPLRLVTAAGMISFVIACLLTSWAFYSHITGNIIRGWSSTIISLYFFGAIQLLSIGVIGEYIGKIYKEVKQRPRFIIEESHLK